MECRRSCSGSRSRHSLSTVRRPQQQLSARSPATVRINRTRSPPKFISPLKSRPMADLDRVDNTFEKCSKSLGDTHPHIRPKLTKHHRAKSSKLPGDSRSKLRENQLVVHPRSRSRKFFLNVINGIAYYLDEDGERKARKKERSSNNHTPRNGGENTPQNARKSTS